MHTPVRLDAIGLAMVAIASQHLSADILVPLREAGGGRAFAEEVTSIAGTLGNGEPGPFAGAIRAATGGFESEDIPLGRLMCSDASVDLESHRR